MVGLEIDLTGDYLLCEDIITIDVNEPHIKSRQ
jgi:predicted RNA-binding protein